MPGRRFRLLQQVLATELVAGDIIAHYIPQVEIVEVRDASGDDPLIDLRWKGRTVTVFAVDLKTESREMLVSIQAAARGHEPMCVGEAHI